MCVAGGGQHLFFAVVVDGDSCYRGRPGVVTVLQAISKRVPILLGAVKIRNA